jgi:hypothetical protein
MNKPTLKPYTLPSRSKSPPHDQNLSKSMSLPTLRKMLTKLKEMEGMKKAQPITKAIKNRRFSSNIKAYSPFELYRKLKNCASESPTFS